MQWIKPLQKFCKVLRSSDQNQRKRIWFPINFICGELCSISPSRSLTSSARGFFVAILQHPTSVDLFSMVYFFLESSSYLFASGDEASLAANCCMMEIYLTWYIMQYSVLQQSCVICMIFWTEGRSILEFSQWQVEAETVH